MKSITSMLILILIPLLNAQETELLAKQKQDFQMWLSTNDISISSTSDYDYRLSVFIENQKEVERHNRSKSSFKKKLNVFAHLSDEEFMSRYASNQSTKKTIENAKNPLKRIYNFVLDLFKWNDNSSKKTKVQSENKNETPKKPAVTILDKVDWVKEGALSPIRDQQTCGGCYSFATIAAIEANYFIKNKKKIELSEQYLIDCGPSGEFPSLHGCNGGTNEEAASFFIIKGVVNRSEYPFISYQGYCRRSVSHYNILVGRDIAENKQISLLESVAIGPVATSIEVVAAFKLYHEGVFDLKFPCGLINNHAVTVVGYDRTAPEPFVLIRNSWGIKWGENGYFRVDLNDDDDVGFCGSTKATVRPIF